MASSNKQLSCADYHVAWICPVPDVELLPARLMLDEEHKTPPYNTHFDENTYVCGAINGHAVVIATCPQGETGNVNAGRLTGSMFKTFPSIRMALLVGTGGGIPRSTASNNPLEDLHLGDVVVGWPGDGKPACIYYDRGRAKANGHFQVVGTMQNPDWRLTNALGILVSDHELGQNTFDDQLTRLQVDKRFAYPGLEQDRLFKATYYHVGDHGSNCTACDPKELVQRTHRAEDVKNKLFFHCGRIATGNTVIRDGKLRDQIGMRCDGALCVEMEAAGVDVNRRCLVIRAIASYADSHKNDAWNFYAAGTAAAFTRELLCKVQPDLVKKMEGVNEGLDGCGKTVLAIESVYRTGEQEPMRAIFWASSLKKAQTKWLVKANRLEQKSGAARLIDCLPQSRKGFILFTIWTREAAIKLAGNNVMALGELEKFAAREVWTKRLLPEHQHQLENDVITDEFRHMLAFLALAIVQAVPFINTNGVAISDYISYYKGSEKYAADLLSNEFEDQSRDRDA